MKRFFALFITIALCLTLFGCMSTEQKKKALQTEQLSIPILAQYINSHYAGAEVIDLKDMTYSYSGGAVPSFEIYASAYVKAKVEYSKTIFEIIIDTENKICYDNLSRKQLEDDIHKKIESISGTKSDAFETVFYPVALKNRVERRDIIGFTLYEDKNVDSVLESGRYSINSLLEYYNNFDKESISKTASELFLSEISMRFVKPREISFSAMNILSTSNGKYNINYTEEPFLIDEEIIIDISPSNTGDSIIEYHDYEVKTIGDYTVGWDKELVDVSNFELIDAKKTITTEYYSGKEFDSVSDKNLSFTAYRKATDYTASRIFYKLPSIYSGTYFITTFEESGKHNISHILSGSKKGEILEYNSVVNKNQGKILLGFYRMSLNEKSDSYSSTSKQERVEI